jgi:hypothetical protein
MTNKTSRGPEGLFSTPPPIYNYVDRQHIVWTERGQAAAARAQSGDDREDLGEE